MSKYTFAKKQRLAVGRRNLQRLVVGGLVAGAGLTGAGMAQAEPAQPAQVAADSGGTLLQDVTVTARRRNESLQDVPIAISVISGDDWADKGGETIKTLQFEVPNTTMNLSNPRQTQTAIRGLGMNPASDGLSSSVGYYIDGVYLDRPGMAAIDLFDLQQVEVLKGPQGTLFGKNTTAGALNIQTAKPTFNNEIRTEATFADYNTQEYRAVLNGKVAGSDVLAVRASVYDDTHGGYLKALNELNPGDEFNNKNRQGARLQVLYQPDPDLQVLWRNDYAIEHDNDGASVLYSTGPAAAFSAYESRAGFGNLLVGPRYQTDANTSQNMMTRNYGTSVTVDKTLNGGYTLTSITALRDFLFRPHNDGLSSETPTSYIANYYSSQAREKEQELTQEVRYASPTGGKADYVVGGYYLWRRENTSQQVYYPGDWSTLTNNSNNQYLNGAATKYDASPTTQSFAVFGQSNYHVDDKVTVTTGLRETFEENFEHLIQYYPQGGQVAPPLASEGNYNGSVGQYNLSLAELLTVSYKPVSNLLTYATISHGAKASGFNTNIPTAGSNFANTTVLVVNPEKALNYELGFKESLPSQHLTFNGDLFLTKMYGYQSNTKVYVNGQSINLIQNAGTAQTQGIELDTTWKPTTNLKLGANGAYDLAYYESYRAGPQVQGASGTQDLSGQRLLNAPKWSAAVNAVYTQPINDDWVAYGSVSYAWKDWQYGNVDDSNYSVIKAYAVTNLRVGLNLNERFDVAAFVDNVFNTNYFYSVGTSATGYGYTGAPGSPRVAGVTLRAKF